jgi:hypothetical protein
VWKYERWCRAEVQRQALATKKTFELANVGVHVELGRTNDFGPYESEYVDIED